jgi:hypothetical protein
MPQNPLPVAAYKEGTAATLPSLGKQGDISQSELHGTKYFTAYGGNLFRASNQAGVTLSAALATTYLGICLSNPAGSGVNLALRGVAGSLFVDPAATIELALILGYAAGGITVHTTPLSPFNSLVGATAFAGKGLVDSACTLVGTPFWGGPLLTTDTEGVGFSTDFQGGIVLQPGAYAAIGATVAGPTSGFKGTIEWEENPT